MNSAPNFGQSMYPTPAAPATTPLLVTVIGGRDFIVEARSVVDVTQTITVGVL